MKQTSDDQEFLVETEDVVEKWHREAVQQGERAVLLRLMRGRFGSRVNDMIEQRVTEASPQQIEAWIDRILSATSLAELLTD